MILNKIAELKKSNKNIEEIYKYTNEIIFEEEDEDEKEEDKNTNEDLNIVSETQRSQSVHETIRKEKLRKMPKKGKNTGSRSVLD